MDTSISEVMTPADIAARPSAWLGVVFPRIFLAILIKK
jgi:hypothetical protein